MWVPQFPAASVIVPSVLVQEPLVLVLDPAVLTLDRAVLLKPLPVSSQASIPDPAELCWRESQPQMESGDSI